MKQKRNDMQRAYEAPVVAEVNLASECILCTSGTLEQFGWVEDEEGWAK
jgi:hypothetical protein